MSVRDSYRGEPTVLSRGRACRSGMRCAIRHLTRLPGRVDPSPSWDLYNVWPPFTGDSHEPDGAPSGSCVPGGADAATACLFLSSVSLPSLDGHRQHILAINNDPAILALFRDLLEEAGYQVSLQNCSDRDLAKIRALKPDLIVLDYMWATEDDSWSLLQMLRMDPATAAIPIVLCTGAVREVAALQPHLMDMGISVVHQALQHRSPGRCHPGAARPAGARDRREPVGAPHG